MRLDVYYFGCDFLDCCPHLYCCLVKCNISATVSSGLPQVSLVSLDIEMIQSGKSFLKFDCWSNKSLKNHKDLIQIMTLFFMSINPRSIMRSFTRSVIRLIWNVIFNGFSYSWYFLKIYFKNNLIRPFQLLVPRLCSFLFLVYTRDQHGPTYMPLFWDILFSNVLPYQLF